MSVKKKYQHYNQLTGLRPTQEQLGIHRTHREAELQGHVVSAKSILLKMCTRMHFMRVCVCVCVYNDEFLM